MSNPENFIKEQTARMLSRDWNLPIELAESLAEFGKWKDNDDGTVSFTSG